MGFPARIQAGFSFKAVFHDSYSLRFIDLKLFS